MGSPLSRTLRAVPAACRRIAAAFVLTTFLVTGQARAWETPEQRALRARWIGLHEEYAPLHLNRLLGYFDSDPELSKLLAALRAQTGKQSALELMAVITICQRDYDDLASQLRPPDVLGSTNIAEGQSRSICLTRNISVGDALATLVHELTHYLGVRRECSDDRARYADSERFSLATIQDPGEEVDAFLAEFRSRIRLEGSRRNIPYIYREEFTDSGRYLGTREEFARLLLAVPGYRESFSSRYERCRARLTKAR